ncbi:DUF309 domain-containing protein [Halomarina rubra]|uniref:DUF309 domain-containing protein n=1 Tax=Halomarina rubra TaxID=2071873 RepID=A0ABD6AUB9_9EURY|nr:DUF309 domain-containing protein [Halomarina rubra]
MDRTERHLRAGLALYTAGEYHAAHEPWERRWLELGDDGDDAASPALSEGADSPDRRLLQGLIQTTAAVYHARTGNWQGASGLAESAQGYLGGLGESHRGVALDSVREYLRTVAVTPEAAERDAPVAITLDGESVDATTEAFETVVLAVEAVVEEYDLDADTVESAVAYAREDLNAGRASSPFVALLVDLVGGGNRPLVVKRLGDHVARHDHRTAGIEGLFDPEE